eukprot:192353-Amphidinium_carterae.1
MDFDALKRQQLNAPHLLDSHCLRDSACLALRQTCDEQDGIGFHMNEVEFEMGSFSNGDPYPEPDVCRGISMPAPGDFSTMCADPNANTAHMCDTASKQPQPFGRLRWWRVL